MKKGWRWFKRAMLGLLALLVATVAFALIAVHTDWGRNIVRGQVENILADTFPGGATIGRIDGSPFGTLVITDVVLNGPDKKPLVSVKRLEVEASLTPLISHQVWVDRVVASGVTITNPRAPEPPDNEPPEPSPWEIVLPHVQVLDAALHIDGQDPTSEPLDIAQLSVFAGLRVAPGSGELSTVAWLDATWTQRTAPIAGIAVASIGDEIAIPLAGIGAAGANVFVAGGRVNNPAGTIVVSAPAKTVSQLAPGVALPSDTWVVIDAATQNSLSRANLVGAMGRSRLHGRVIGSVEKMTANAVISATNVNLAMVSKGAATGRGDALVGAVIGRDGLRGTLIAATGQVVAPRVHRRRKKRDVPVDETPLSVPSLNVLVAFDALPERARSLVLASAAGRALVAIVGQAHTEGPVGAEVLVIDSANVGAKVPDLLLASGGIVPVRGSLEMGADAHGQLGKDLTVGGWFDGRRIRAATLGIADVRGAFATKIGKGLSGSANATATGIVNAGKPVGKATVTAKTRDDGRIGVIVDATPAMAPVHANVDAIVSLPTPDGAIDIDIESHRIDLPNGTWAGKGGSVHIDKKQIAVKDFRSHSGDARLVASVNAGRGNGVITGKVKLSDADLARMDKKARGTVDVDLAIEKRGIKWKGGGTVVARGVALSPDALPVDGNLDLSVDNRRVKVGVKASSPSIGGGRVSIEVDGPRDLTDVNAWKKVARADLHGVTVGLDSLQGAAISGGAVPGIFDGTIDIREGVPDGKLRVRGIGTPLGTAGADLTVALDDVGFLDVHGEGSVGNAGDVTIGARIQIPDRPFDVEVYKRVGKDLVKGASLQTSDIEINPDVLRQLGVLFPYSGIVVAKVDVGTGGSSIGVGVDVKGLTGGPLRAPLDLHVGASVDEKQTTAELKVSARQGTLVELKDARTPVSLDQWIALAAKKPFALPTAPIEGTLSIPTLDAKTTLAIVGRRDVVAGTIAGQIVAGGTLADPTASGTIDLANISVRPRLTGKPPPALKSLHVAAAWAKDKSELKITGEETPGEPVRRANDKSPPKPPVTPTLLVEASVNPKDFATFLGTAKIANFDLTPIAVFLPGMLVGAQGKLDTDLKITGLGPTGRARGTIDLVDMRLPFSPLFSPLRQGKLHVNLDDLGVGIKLDGVIGGSKSTVSLVANTDPLFVDTSLTVKITELTPIGFLQPKITANVRGTLHRQKWFWSGPLEVSRGLVFIPEARGNDLLEDYTPSDLIFVGEEEEVDVESARLRPPTKPFLVMDVDIKTTRIEMPSFVIPTIINVPIIERGKATAAGKVRVSVGDTIGMDGEILVDRGEAEVLGRKYEIDLGQIGFDGTIDPLFDLKLAHEFESEGVTTFVRFAGRLSEIDSLEPEFTADPGTFSQSQLFGFFLGASPGADTGQEGQDALSAAGQAAFSSIASAYLRKQTGNKIDVLRCDPETSTTGRSCMLGKFFGRRDQLFLGALRRLAPRLDENQTELRLDYRFRNGVQFELAGGDHGIFGFDFLRRHRF